MATGVLRAALTLRFEGTFDEPRRQRFCRLADLEPRGRLDDGEDETFGRRELHHGPADMTSLRLSRVDDERWFVDLSYRGVPPSATSFEQVRDTVLAAARETGLILRWSVPDLVDDGLASPDCLPDREARWWRLGRMPAGPVPDGTLTTLRAALGLYRDLGPGRLRRRRLREGDPVRGMLELRPDDSGGAGTLVLLDDGHDLDPVVVEGVRRQVEEAVQLVGVRVVGSSSGAEPVPPLDDEVWALVWGPGTPSSLAELFDRLRARDQPWEYRRGLLLAALRGVVVDPHRHPAHGPERLLPEGLWRGQGLGFDIVDFLR